MSKKDKIDKIDKKSNIEEKAEKKDKKAILAILILIVVIYFYLTNSKLVIPNINDVSYIEVKDNSNSNKIENNDDIAEILKAMDKGHGKYLVMGIDGTEVLYTIDTKQKDGKNFVTNIRKSTIEYNGNFYDINPDYYEEFISLIKQYIQE